jgi:hypothetical protein
MHRCRTSKDDAREPKGVEAQFLGPLRNSQNFLLLTLVGSSQIGVIVAKIKMPNFIRRVSPPRRGFIVWRGKYLSRREPHFRERERLSGRFAPRLGLSSACFSR